MLVISTPHRHGLTMRVFGSRSYVVMPPEHLIYFSVTGIRALLESEGFAIDSAELSMIPKTTVEIGDEVTARRVVRLVEGLEDNDDVQDVYANFDIPEELLEAVTAP